MKLDDLQQLANEGTDRLPALERRTFLKIGLRISGVFLAGQILSLVPAPRARAALSDTRHYAMLIRERFCIDCERCKEACSQTNAIPGYGFRTEILEKTRPATDGNSTTIFMPVLCNQCNNPPCVRACPTRATWKDPANGIVMMSPKQCIGCKTCMTACPYNARYFNEETRAVDKCDFCHEALLGKGETSPACVSACPADVRIFGDLNDTGSRIYTLLHQPESTTWVLRPELGALPNVFYSNI